MAGSRETSTISNHLTILSAVETKAVTAGICITKAMNLNIPLGGALRAAARPWLIPAGKYIPADRLQRSTPPQRGTPPRPVREVAAL